MKKHQYRVTVEHLADAQGQPVAGKRLVFNAPNHDDLFELLEKVKQKHPATSEETLCRFMVGIKMLGEVILENRQDEFFTQFSPFMKDMMMTLKGQKNQS